MIERTLSIIKPDAVKSSLIGEIYIRFKNAGLKIIASKMKQISVYDASILYAVHEKCYFYKKLLYFISSGPSMIQVLEGDNAVSVHREIIGSTDPKKSPVGSIRFDFGINIQSNTIHGSDSVSAASYEINYFFSQDEIIEY